MNTIPRKRDDIYYVNSSKKKRGAIHEYSSKRVDMLCTNIGPTKRDNFFHVYSSKKKRYTWI